MKKILVVVDYQNDFVTGSLGFEKAVTLEEGILKKIEEYKKNHDEVVFTYDTHPENYLETQEGKNLPIVHCVENTEGWQLYGKVKYATVGCKIFKKPTFGSMDLAVYLACNQYTHVEIIGLVSNICVLSNAIMAKAALPEAIVTVDASLTSCFDESMNEKALDILEGVQVNVINRK